MFRLFGNSKVSIEDQLQRLASCGLQLSLGVSVEDLFIFHSRAEMESKPYSNLVEALGYEIEREPFTPICPRLWMCDCERIEDNGAYVSVIERLHLMALERLPITNVRDGVDIDGGKAWVEFDLFGNKVHWDAKIQDDWLDPYVVVKFDALLGEHTELRVYSNHTDYGQVAFFGCFTRDEFKRFERLSRVKLIETNKQA